MDSAVELHLRQLIFERLADIVAENCVVSRAELEQLQVGDQQWRVIDRNRGIRNPKELLATLSVISNPKGPYADKHVGDSLSTPTTTGQAARRAAIPPCGSDEDDVLFE